MQPLLQWKSSITYDVCVCVCVALVIQHAPRMRHVSSVACPALKYFFILSHKRHDFRKKKLFTQNVCFDFLCNLFSEAFHILRRTERNQKCILVFRPSPRYSCPVLIKLEFSRQFFEKYSTIEFHENRSSGSRVVPCGQTDRHDEVNP